MKRYPQRIGSVLLILVLLLSLAGTALAAEAGEYTLTTDGGGSRKPLSRADYSPVQFRRRCDLYDY